MKRRFFPLIALIALIFVVIFSCNKDTSVTGVKLNKDSLTLGVNDTETLIATVLPENATNKAVTFTSSNTLVATVMPNGLVTAISKGTATIVVTTTEGNFSASCMVKVEEVPVTGVILNKTTLVLDINETATLKATVLPENATIKGVYWTSSNPAVATVGSNNGIITPQGFGKTIVTVTTIDGNYAAKCEVQIVSSNSEDLLTQPNGWQLTAATFAFEGYVYDIFDDFMECEKDDITYFKKDKTIILNYGKILCEWQTGIEEVLGNWELFYNNQSLLLYQYYTDWEEGFNATVLQLNESTLKLKFIITFDDYKSAKSSRWKNFIKTTTSEIFEITYTYTRGK